MTKTPSALAQLGAFEEAARAVDAEAGEARMAEE